MRAIVFSILMILVPTTKSFAADVVCLDKPEFIGGYPWMDILSDRDLRQAILCAVNQAGIDVTGESAFTRLYNVNLPYAFTSRIEYRRKGDYDPISNRINTYTVKFPAIFDGRIETRVTCVMRIELRKHHDRDSVLINLADCRASAFGIDQRGEKTNALEAWALVTFADGKSTQSAQH
jgi:hypothetical protein